jgi:hypothetical protein
MRHVQYLRQQFSGRSSKADAENAAESSRAVKVQEDGESPQEAQRKGRKTGLKSTDSGAWTTLSFMEY